jgi:hypothetical protein
MLPSDSLCGKVSDLVGNVAPDALASDPHAAATRRRAPHKKIEESLSPCQIAMSPRVFVECLDIMSLIMKGYSVAASRRATTRRSLVHLPINRQNEVKCKAYLHFFLGASLHCTRSAFAGVKSCTAKTHVSSNERPIDALHTHQS